MNTSSRRIAVSGMMVALGAAVMLLGGVIPIATFCCPAIAGLARDRALYAEYAESARRKAENEFELTRLLDEVYNCYL